MVRDKDSRKRKGGSRSIALEKGLLTLREKGGVPYPSILAQKGAFPNSRGKVSRYTARRLPPEKKPSPSREGKPVGRIPCFGGEGTLSGERI